MTDNRHQVNFPESLQRTYSVGCDIVCVSRPREHFNTDYLLTCRRSDGGTSSRLLIDCMWLQVLLGAMLSLRCDFKLYLRGKKGGRRQGKKNQSGWQVGFTYTLLHQVSLTSQNLDWTESGNKNGAKQG